MNWQPIETYPDDRKVRVVIAININIDGCKFPYTSDPYCVFKCDGKLHRWPHPLAPTHWCDLPSTKEL